MRHGPQSANGPDKYGESAQLRRFLRAVLHAIGIRRMLARRFSCPKTHFAKTRGSHGCKEHQPAVAIEDIDLEARLYALLYGVEMIYHKLQIITAVPSV